MKYILTFLIILVGYSADKHDPKVYTKTGYDQFAEINLKNKEAFIINDLSEETINNELKDLKFMLFGKREKVLNEFEDCSYVSETIFSRSNKTRKEVVFKYDTSLVSYKAVTVNVSGSLSAKGVFKGKNKELTATGEIEGGVKTENYTKSTEDGSFSVVIYPGKKISLRMVGEAKVLNGVRKDFAFGICMKKGAWEVITVLTTCYELLEENA